MSFSFTPTTNAGLGGAAPAAGAFSFGARPATTTAPPAFGAASATPAFGAPAAAPAFGAAASAAPAFGAATTAPAFGAATTAPAFGAAASAAPAFGAATAAPAFGAATAAPAFGAATSTPSFGAPSAAAPAFGTPAATQAPAFGAAAPTATVAPTFSFATPATTAPTTAPPAFGFGATATTAAAAMPAALGTGIGSFAFGKPQTTTAASLNFSTTTTTATAQPFQTGLKLGGSTSTTALGTGGIFGKPAAQAAAPAPTAFVGLGGIDVSATQPKLGDNKQDGIKIKETQVPDEIVKTVDALKAYIKQQKTTSSDIGRTSTSKFTNVAHEITNLKWALQNMSNSVEGNNQQIRLLRQETSKAIQSLEMAQRTQDTPAGLQFEHSAPFQYFQCLVAKYELDLVAFRQQIALTERHMHALSNPQSISPEDLKRGFRQLNESFISLAGRLHELHQRVEEQKEHYLNLRRYRLRDATNVFERIDNPPLPSAEPQRISSGPTPFSNISAISSLNKSYAAATAANTAGNAASK
ncbi:nuclear pore complex protein Nup58 [Drosophila bipectinata]|uniref:nuclear pore complex protein Nup58 n=1 Tax=Drosophila bipectinata TaxID=42026 RepID=UPI001C8B045B|nr:nuclear pore complex protein Nup58 [Drosophila bipectinata]